MSGFLDDLPDTELGHDDHHYGPSPPLRTEPPAVLVDVRLWTEREALSDLVIDMRCTLRPSLATAHDILGDRDTRYSAPAIVVDRAAHRLATNAQNRATVCGTYGAERIVARDALREAGMAWAVGHALAAADRYFNGIGVRSNTETFTPGTRRNCRSHG